jgi:hypothetical protein
LVAVILAVVAAGIYMTAKNAFDLGNAPVSFSSIAAAVITFFWLTPGSRASAAHTSADEGLQRRAIASAVLILYLILVGTFAFWRQDQTMAEESKLLLNNFTTTVGIVIVFYFGASAYVEGKTRAQSGAGGNGGKDSIAQPGATGSAPPAARPLQ